MTPFSKMKAIGEKKPVITRDGRNVTIIGESPVDIAYPVVGLIEGNTEFDTWTSDGQYYKTAVGPKPNDLIMKPTKREGWIAFGNPNPESSTVGFVTHAFPDEMRAKASFFTANGSEAKGTLKISWEE